MRENGEFEIREHCLVIRLPEEVDHHNTVSIKKYADHYLMDERVEQIVFDFMDTRFMDSAGIGLIVGRNEKISSLGGRLIAVNVNDRIRKMLVLAGILEKIQILD